MSHIVVISTGNQVLLFCLYSGNKKCKIMFHVKKKIDNHLRLNKGIAGLYRIKQAKKCIPCRWGNAPGGHGCP